MKYVVTFVNKDYSSYDDSREFIDEEALESYANLLINRGDYISIYWRAHHERTIHI